MDIHGFLQIHVFKNDYHCGETAYNIVLQDNHGARVARTVCIVYLEMKSFCIAVASFCNSVGLPLKTENDLKHKPAISIHVATIVTG